MSTHNDFQKILKKCSRKSAFASNHHKQILKFTICLQAMLIPFTFFLSLSCFQGRKNHVLCDILRKKVDYHVNSWGIPQEELSLVIHHVIF